MSIRAELHRRSGPTPLTQCRWLNGKFTQTIIIGRCEMLESKHCKALFSLWTFNAQTVQTVQTIQTVHTLGFKHFRRMVAVCKLQRSLEGCKSLQGFQKKPSSAPDLPRNWSTWSTRVDQRWHLKNDSLRFVCSFNLCKLTLQFHRLNEAKWSIFIRTSFRWSIFHRKSICKIASGPDSSARWALHIPGATFAIADSICPIPYVADSSLDSLHARPST